MFVMQHQNWDRIDFVTWAAEEELLNPVIPELQARLTEGKLPGNVHIHTVSYLSLVGGECLAQKRNTFIYCYCCCSISRQVGATLPNERIVYDSRTQSAKIQLSYTAYHTLLQLFSLYKKNRAASAAEAKNKRDCSNNGVGRGGGVDDPAMGRLQNISPPCLGNNGCIAAETR